MFMCCICVYGTSGRQGEPPGSRPTIPNQKSLSMDDRTSRRHRHPEGCALVNIGAATAYARSTAQLLSLRASVEYRNTKTATRRSTASTRTTLSRSRSLGQASPVAAVHTRRVAPRRTALSLGGGLGGVDERSEAALLHRRLEPACGQLADRVLLFRRAVQPLRGLLQLPLADRGALHLRSAREGERGEGRG